MTSIHFLRADDHRRMAWKNGGGETLEVAISPAGAALDAFDWRVSMATIAADGPFSAFLGVDRTLALLEGDGMILAIDGRPPIRLNAGDPPLAFPADAATAATLAEGAVTDLNVMTRRDRCAHLVEPIVGPQDVAVADGAVLLLFGDGLAIETDDGGVVLGYRDFARIEGPADLHVGQAPDAEALLIRIWPLA
jgi:environmental stress-induced protein Ves